MLDNYHRLLALCDLVALDKRTLVSDPFALLNRLWSRTQSHEVALDNVFRAVGVEP